MKRNSFVKVIVSIVCLLVVLILALRIAGSHGLLQSAMHKALAPNYAAYSFSSYEDGRFYTVGPTITADGEIIDGDISDGVRFCPSRSGWVCLEAFTFKFAVPRRALKVGDHWKFSGVEYTLLPSYMEMIPGGPVSGSETPLWHYRILGRQYDLYTIRMGSGNAVKIFLFSPKNGLVGYMDFEGVISKDDVRNATFWLRGENGPGSVDFDSSIAAKALLSPDEVIALAK